MKSDTMTNGSILFCTPFTQPLSFLIHINMSTQIKATVIADSINVQGNRMTTMEIEYPRFILAELNTHRMLSKNSASSRAIPVAKMQDQMQNNPAMPVYWGANQPGMTAKEEIPNISMAKDVWDLARKTAMNFARFLSEDLKLHKQTANRITEPWMLMKTVISGTEWTNLEYLRDHPDAQPEFGVLAKCIKTAKEASTPMLLQPNEWHLPYVKTIRNKTGSIEYYDENDKLIPLEKARMISASCCAQVSYRMQNASLEKAEDIFAKLNLHPEATQPMHASPVEHQATPISPEVYGKMSVHWPSGVTHADRKQQLWSGNLNGWIQFRKTIANEAKW